MPSHLITAILLCSATIAAIAHAGTPLVVAADGTGQFKTVQAAIDAVPAKNAERVVIQIKPGTYKERIQVPPDKPLITFQGEDAKTTILTYNFSAKSVEDGKEVGTSGSASTMIFGRDFVAENVTFENSAGEVGQAVALRFNSDRGAFRNCRFLGWQDTLYVHNGRCYFKDCYIEGRVDFIFGRSTAVFEGCTIHSKNGGYVTAAATPKENPFGLVFLNCKLTGEGAPAYLGRPWRPEAAVAFINCEMGDHIIPAGWDNWRNADNEKTARFSEFNSTGPGARPADRVRWSRQMHKDEIARYTPDNILRGHDDWQPDRPAQTATRPSTTQASEDKRMPFIISDFGAVADGKTITTAAIQKAIDTCAANGGGTVIVPAGKYVTGTLWMRSNLTLHLEPGATLLGAQDISAFPVWAPAWEGVPSYAAMIAGEGLTNVAITGRGTIDGGGKMWWELFYQKKIELVRPRLIRLVDCRNVLVEGVTLTNSPFWTLNPLACDQVTIRGVIVHNPPDSPNTDGINPDSCSNVHISDCHIDVGDDCVTIKSGSEEEGRRQFKACENITVTNCTMIHGHGGVVIGSEMSGGVRNITISNCTFVGTDRGIRIKSRRGRGSAVEDLRVSNIVMENVLCPLVINLFYGPGAWNDQKVTSADPQPVTDATPRFRRLRFSNISARGVKYSACYVLGLPEMYVEDIAYNDISIYLDPKNTEAGQSAMAPIAEKLCRAGFYMKNVRKLQINNVQVFDQLGPAVALTNADDVTLNGVTTHNAQDGVPLLALKDVNGAYVLGCSAPAGASALLALSGGATRDITMGHNRTTGSTPASVIAADVPAGAIR